MPLNGAEPSTPSVGSHVHERARAHARRARAHAAYTRTCSRGTHRHTERPGIVSSRENARSSSAVYALWLPRLFSPKRRRAARFARRGPLSQIVYWSAPGERSSGETVGKLRQGRRQGKIDACKRSRVYAFVYRTAYGGSMCRATKLAPRRNNGFYATLV